MKNCYSDFFNKNELVTYKDSSDLIEKVLKYKKDNKSRKLIAKRGKEKYLHYFNSKKVADYIVSKTYHVEKSFLW